MLFSSLLLRSQGIFQPIAWLVASFCFGIYLFVKGFLLLQRRHLILNTPASKIRSAALGMVEVSGQAVGPYTMPAPITNRPCYYYRTVVWEWKRQGRSSKWVKVAAECTHLPFFLDDNTGRVLVDPHGADLDLHRDFHQQFCDSFFTLKQPAPPNVHGFLSRHGIMTTNKIKVEEFCIKPKNSLFILGTLAENPGLEVSAEPVYESEPAAVAAGRVLSFAMAAGSFAIGRTQEFGDPAGRPAPPITPSDGSCSLPASEFVAVPSVVLMKGTNNKTFLISWRSQQELARSLGWKCAAMIWGGPALALLSLYLMLKLSHLL